jgi:hypothetical protein
MKYHVAVVSIHRLAGTVVTIHRLAGTVDGGRSDVSPILVSGRVVGVVIQIVVRGGLKV